MNHLEVPQPLSGSRIERQQAIGEQVGAGTVGAVKVVLGAGRGSVHYAPLLVDRKLTPNVCATYLLPCVLGPALVSILTGMWDRVKGPNHVARWDVESPQMARRGTVSLIRRRAENQQILKYA